MFTSAFSTLSKRVALGGALAALGFALTGCAGFWASYRKHEAGSVVQFLYPDRDQPFIQPTTPTLHLPLRVGIAFIPPGKPGENQIHYAESRFNEAQKTALLNQVAAQFRALPFVESIQIVPTTYLRPGGGFENLDQLRALLGIDVIALLAYDQAQNTHDTEWNLAYWTIVGAYVVPAQKNETHTLMEAVVYDIPSRSLLFRAPGTSAVKGNSTLIRTEEELGRDSLRGFQEASQQMTSNLHHELELFKVRAKSEPESVTIVHRSGYTGGGSLDLIGTVLLVTIAGTGWLLHHQRRSATTP